MNVLSEFLKSKKDLNAKSLEGYEYEVDIRLKDVTEGEFAKLPKINSVITTEEVLYSVKSSSIVTVRKISSEFFIKEKISSKIIPKFNAEIILSLERKHYKEDVMALKIKKYKERYTVVCDKFKIDLTRVRSGTHTRYEVEFEIVDENCEYRLLELTMGRIRSSTTQQISRLINKLVPSLDLYNYRFPKPIDITIKELDEGLCL